MVCSEMSLSASSKLNMALSLDDLPLPAVSDTDRPVEKERDIASHSLLERGEVGVVACPAQVFDLGLREILILAADCRRHVDIFDSRLPAERAERGGDEITEAARLAGSDVEDPRHRRCIKEPAHHRDRVVDIDEVALLLAIGDAVAVGFEQTHALSGLRLVKAFGH